MILRLVELKVKSEQLLQLQEFYQRDVVPALNATDGCLNATLVQSSSDDGAGTSKCISMTLWQDEKFAEHYEKSELYKWLIQRINRYLAESSDWKINLSADLTVNYDEVPEAPVTKKYAVASPGDSASALHGAFYMRIVSPQVRPGQEGRLKHIYNNEILPVLRTVKGCRYASLVENIHNEGQFLSLTIWNKKDDADKYESSGLFARLRDKVRDTFTEAYQWKIDLEKERSGKVMTSEEMRVDGYRMVAGESFL
jgi:quinol monooxygenase YgiN